MRRASVRNRDDDGSGSFELLLDTMCNTFGGVLFIALLLTIISQSIKMTTNSDIYETQKFTIHKQALVKNIERVKLNLSLKEQRDKLTEKIVADRVLLASSKETVKALEKEIELMNEKISAAEKLQQRKFRLPRLHPVRKSPVFLAIRQDKFYTITNISYAIVNVPESSWIERGYDTSDTFIREDQNRITIELLTGRGQVIKKGSENRGKLKQAISNLNPAKEFITFAVYPDSFAGFNYVKEIFIDRGFEYNWIIIKDKLSLVKSAGEIHAQ